jgi:hypothetical protein
MDNKKEYILCSAIRRLETHTCPKVLIPKDIYDYELGLRHADILHKFEGIVSKSPLDQGFFTSRLRFVDRYEAYRIAVECGQIQPGTEKRLYSEDIY